MAETETPTKSKYRVLRGKVSQNGKYYRKGDVVTMLDSQAAVTQKGMLKKV